MSLFLYNLNESDRIASFPQNIRQWSQSNHTTNSTVSQTSLSPKAEEVSIRETHEDSQPFHVGTFIWRYLTVKTVIVWLFITTYAKYLIIVHKNVSIKPRLGFEAWRRVKVGTAHPGLPGTNCWLPFTPCWPMTEEGSPWFSLRLAGEPAFDLMLTGGGRGWDRTLC